VTELNLDERVSRFEVPEPFNGDRRLNGEAILRLERLAFPGATALRSSN
jgi:hypothetical protein